MCDREFSLSDISRGETVIVHLPMGRILEIEWLDSEINAIRTLGFESLNHYWADEEYRLAGYQPQLRRFHGHIPMRDV